MNMLIEATHQLALAADKATDGAVHEDIAKIVKLHAKIALGIVFIPVPGADMAAAAANTWTMYVRINKALDIPFSENVVKSLASGIGTNILSNVPILAAGEIIKLFPVLGPVVGGAVMAGSLYGVTIAAGIVYMRALAIILNQQSEFTEVNLKAVADSLVSDKDSMKKIIKDANREYKVAKASGELYKEFQQASL
jgi:uncharacterized protein (DUF697 family)